MELKTIKEKRKKNIDKLVHAEINVDHIQVQLRKNLEYINDISRALKKIKKAEYCFNYIKINWYYSKFYEDEMKLVEKRKEEYSHLYEEAILKRKILKLKLKQAQRIFSKRQKSNIKFEKRYFNVEI